MPDAHRQPGHADLFAVEPVRRGECEPGAVAVHEVDRADLGAGRRGRPVDDRAHQLVPGPGRGRQAGDLLEEGQLREPAPRVAIVERFRASRRSWRAGAHAGQGPSRSRPERRTETVTGSQPAPTVPCPSRDGRCDRGRPTVSARSERRGDRSPPCPIAGLPALRPALRARCVRRRVRGGRRRAVAGTRPPLALAGLGSLGHRGAFAADGASSDGAGVLLPLEPSVLALAGDDAQSRPAGRRDALPAAWAKGAGTAACWSSSRPWPPSGFRRRVARGSRRSRRARSARRARRCRTSARRSSPPRPDRDARFELVSSSRDGAWRSARRAGPELAVFASLGIVAQRRLQRPRRGWTAGRALPGPVRGRPRGSATRSSTSATPRTRVRLEARPAVPAHRSQRRDQHGARQSRAGAGAGGSLGGRVRAARGARVRSAASPTAPTRSRSMKGSTCSSRPAGGSRPRSALAPGCAGAAPLGIRWPVRSVPASLGSSPRGTARRPRVHRRPAGRRDLDRNGLRPLAITVTTDRLVAAASEAGAVPLPGCETVRRGRLGHLAAVCSLGGRTLSDKGREAQPHQDPLLA